MKVEVECSGAVARHIYMRNEQNGVNLSQPRTYHEPRLMINPNHIERPAYSLGIDTKESSARLPT